MSYATVIGYERLEESRAKAVEQAQKVESVLLINGHRPSLTTLIDFSFQPLLADLTFCTTFSRGQGFLGLDELRAVERSLERFKHGRNFKRHCSRASGGPARKYCATDHQILSQYPGWTKAIFTACRGFESAQTQSRPRETPD